MKKTITYKKEIKHICSWCKTDMKKTVWEIKKTPQTYDHEHTHGMCLKCFDNLIKEK